MLIRNLLECTIRTQEDIGERKLNFFEFDVAFVRKRNVK